MSLLWIIIISIVVILIGLYCCIVIGKKSEQEMDKLFDSNLDLPFQPQDNIDPKFPAFDGTGCEKPMKRFTTDFAKEWLRKNNYYQGGYIYYLAQDKNGNVNAFINEPRIIKDAFLSGYRATGRFVCKMFEHPKGWQNSKVTREKNDG